MDINGGCTAERPCSECQGDCNEDTDVRTNFATIVSPYSFVLLTFLQCEGSLECYRRPGDYGTPVPGCQGRGTLGHDYCYEPSMWVLRLRTPHCSTGDPCDVCQGDCNSDSECKGDLKCFQRSYLETTIVPGCNNLGINGKPLWFFWLLMGIFYIH